MTGLTLTWLQFAHCALLIGAAGPELSRSGDIIADKTGISGVWIGLVLLGAVTSLPELVTGMSAVTLADEPNIAEWPLTFSPGAHPLRGIIAAIRIGALNMAIANLLGSNLFDMLVLAIDDIFYTKGPLLWAVSPAHAFSAGSAVVMTGLVIVSLLYRPGQRLFRAVGWTSLGLFVLYLFNTYVVYRHGS